MFLLGLNGCGFKKAPYYLEETKNNNDNVEFIIKKPTNEINNKK